MPKRVNGADAKGNGKICEMLYSDRNDVVFRSIVAFTENAAR